MQNIGPFFFWFFLALATGLLTILLVLIAPALVMHMLWSGNTRFIDGVNNQIQDCYYVVGKVLRKFLAK